MNSIETVAVFIQGHTIANAKPLSPREHEVFKLYGQGLRNVDIAQRLGLSIKTTSAYLSRTELKLGIKGRGNLRIAASLYIAQIVGSVL